MGGGASRYKAPRTQPTGSSAKCTAIQRPQWWLLPWLSPPSWSVRMVPGYKWPLGLSSEQREARHTTTRTDWWVVSLVNYLSVSPREQESIALILACRCWTSFTVWLVLVRGFGYPMTVSIWDRGMLWPVSLTKTYMGNLFAIGKQPQLLHRHSQPSTGLRIPLSICTVIFQFLNTTKLCVVSTSQGPKFLLP